MITFRFGTIPLAFALTSASLLTSTAFAMPHPDHARLSEALDEALEQTPVPTTLTVTFRRADGQVRDSYLINTQTGDRKHTHWTYDSQNRMTSYAYDSYRRDFEYDAGGRVVRQTSSLGDQQTWAFDSLGRQIAWSSFYPGSPIRTSTTTYSADGLESTQTYSDLVVITRRFDARGNEIYYLFSTSTAPGTPVFRTFTATNKLQTLTVGDGPTTRYFYDARDLQIRVIRGTELLSTTGYDAQGREVLFATRGYTKGTVYDDVARTKTVTFSVFDADGTIYESTEVLGFDELGRETSRDLTVEDGTRTTTLYFYDVD